MRGPAVLVALVLIAGCRDRSGDRLAALAADAEAAVRDGQYAEALSLARQGADGSRAAGLEPWADRFRLLEADALVQDRQGDAASRLLAAPFSAGPDATALNARREYLEAQLETRRLFAAGRLPDALARLEAVGARATAAGATATALDADLLRAQVLAISGQPGLAERLLLTVRTRAAAAGDPYREAAALNNLGMTRFTVSRYDEALEYLEPIVDLTGLERTGLYAGALNNAGISHARLGDFEQAIALQERAIAAVTAPVYLNRALGELGNTFILSGEPERAVPYLERAFRVATDAGLTADAALWAGNLAAASIVLGRWDEAERHNAEAVRLGTAPKQPARVYNDQNAARIAAGRGRLDEARAIFARVLATPGLEPSVAWEAHAGLASVLFAAGERANAIREFDRALVVIEKTSADLLKTEQQFFFPARLRHFYDEYVEALVTAGLDDTALEVADASRAQVLAERQGVAALHRQTAATLRAMAKESGAAFVVYWLGGKRAHAWVVTARAVTRVDLSDPADIARLAVRYRAEVEQSLANPLTTATSGDALAAAVLTPVLPLVPAGSTVVLVADRALHDVNFEMLPVGSPRRYWIEDVTIEVAPSLGILATARPRAARPSAPILLVGDPAPPSPDLAPLAHAGNELDAIAAAMASRPVTALRGLEATPAAYRNTAPEQFGLIHFAAHATVSTASPLDSAIELSAANGSFKLYARDVAGVRLEADLVTISACRSAAARAYASEGLVGFAWAFLRAGSRRVVAGLWDVDDRSTSTLMAGFYRGLAAGLGPAPALRAAKLDAIARGGNFAKPYYWAPFQTFTAVAPAARR